ncbi:MAG: hypothetical protein Q9201_001567 [Fulgogasparrea decipioides]
MPPKKRQRKLSKRTPDQQTITQMDPFKAQLHPEEDLADPSGEHSPHVDNPPARENRRATSSTPFTSTVRTRSAKKQAAKYEIKEEVKSTRGTSEPSRDTCSQATTAPPLPESGVLQMPPPKTPKTIRRKEIPSSQSPEETPWVVRTQKKKDDMVVTPLKERSVNTPSRGRFSLRRRNAHAAPKLMVADSTDIGNEDSEVLFPLIAQSKKSQADMEEPSSPRFRSPKPSTPNAHSREILSGKLTTHSSSSLQGEMPPSLKRKEMVAGSDEEEISPIHQSFVQTSAKPRQTLPLTSSSVTEAHNVNQTQLLEDDITNLKKTASLPEKEDDQNDKSFETIPTQLILHQSKNTNLLRTPSATRQRKSQTPMSASNEGSARSTAKSLHSSSPTPIRQAPALETESQFENAWREYTPPPPDLEIPQSDEQSIKAIDRLTQPTSLPTPKRVDPANPSPPIPISQATTTDITQTSPQHFPHLNQSSTISLHTEHLPSSPPPQEFQSSSPFQTRKEAAADTYMGYQGWNGVQMTDSQLLPASLLNDGLEPSELLSGDNDLF